MPNLECRMYEPRFPEVDAAVMIQVKHIADMGAYVSLLEYNNIEGMILFSELSRRRIRSISSLIKVGRQEPAIVLRVDRDKGYIDLSKRRVSEEEAHACEDKYNKSKLVHSIMRHVAETLEIDLEPLYQRIGWPLYRKYGHAFEAFKLIVSDPDAILDALTYEEKETGPDGQEVVKVVPAVTPEVKDSLVKNIRRRMTPQPLKIRADIEMKCFQFDGVLHIKQAMKQAEAAGNDNCPVKIKLVAPPLYVLTTQTLDKDQGISVLTDAIKACTSEIEKHKGKLVVKEPPRAVSEREDKLFLDQIDSLMEQNAEVDGDDDDSEEEDTGMGDVDLTNSGVSSSSQQKGDKQVTQPAGVKHEAMLLRRRHSQPPPFLPAHFLLLLLAVARKTLPAAAVGVTWGFASSHPLPAAQVVQGILLPNSVPRVRLAAASSDALSALAGTGIAVTIGIPDSLLRPLAASRKTAAAWVHDNITRYASSVRFEYIAVGDEPFLLSHGQHLQPFVVPAAKNIQHALVDAKLSSKMKVVVPCSAEAYQNASTLPSKASFRPDFNETMVELLSFLANNSSPFMVDLNPFLSFQQNRNLSLDYYLFQLMAHPVKDGQKKYDNYFDASIDALVTALTKAGFGDMDIMVGKAGWPTDAAVNATPAFAQSFTTGLVNHLAKKSGTPLRPKVPPIETYLFSLLDEDQRSTTSGGCERHYGVFTFDGQAKYHVNIGQGPKALKSAPGVEYLPSRWCVVDNNKDVSNVSSSFAAACSNGDCTALSAGGSCSGLGWPGNVSYAFNNYYQQHDQSEASCNFNGLGLITTVDPSVDNCLFTLAIRTSAAASVHPTLVTTMFRVLILLFCLFATMCNLT